MNNKNNKGLLRTLTLKDAVGVGLGAIIGAGIFVVTGIAAGVSGPAFLLGLMAAGTVATFNALSSAQLAAIYPDSGGTYEYGYKLINPAVGFCIYGLCVNCKPCPCIHTQMKKKNYVGKTKNL